MPIPLPAGHTFAIGLGPRAFEFTGTIEQTIGASGYARAEDWRAALYAAAGWRPVVVYDAQHAPIQGPERVSFVALAGRVVDGAVPDAVGIPSPLSVFQDVRYVLDLGNPAEVRSMLRDADAPEAPGLPAQLPPRAVLGGAQIGGGLGFIGGAYLGSRSRSHPWLFGVLGALLGSSLGAGIGSGVGNVASG